MVVWFRSESRFVVVCLLVALLQLNIALGFQDHEAIVEKSMTKAGQWPHMPITKYQSDNFPAVPENPKILLMEIKTVFFMLCSTLSCEI
jgi:hypothetical protein